MFARGVIQSGSTLQGEFGVDVSDPTYGFKLSPEYVIRRTVKLQFKVVGTLAYYYNDNLNSNHCHHHNIYVRFDKVRLGEDTHIIKLKSKKLKRYDEIFSVNSNTGTWHLLYDTHRDGDHHRCFDVKVTLVDTTKPKDSPFASLHEDTEITDFELRGEDGSVHVHKFALASSSPVLRRMLAGSWKESTEGVVDIPGTTRASLQHFKDFIYLGTLPSTGLDHLLVLSGYYMMPDLEGKCVANIRKSLTAKMACEYLQLAGKHNLNMLMLEILNFVRHGDIQVDEIEEYLFPSKLQAEDKI